MLSVLQTPYNDFVGNGIATVFSTTFAVFRAEDIAISIDGSIVTTGFTVSNLGVIDGATITFAVAPAADAAIKVNLVAKATRDTDYQGNGDFLADTVNRDFDRIWQALQMRTPQAPFAVIDMADDDYTMTDAESNASGKLVINAVAGKILLWPSTSDSTAPNKQTLAFLVAAPGLILQSESGGEAVLINSKIADLIYLPGMAIFIANSSIVSVKDIPETTYTLLDSDIGSMLRFTNGDAITLTINIEQITDGMNFSIEQAGAGQVSFDGTATLRNADSHTKTFGQFARVDFIQSGNYAMTFSGRTAA